MKLLIVVDYQNDFVDGSLGFEKAKAIENRLVIKIEKHIQEGGIVLFTMDTHKNDYLTTREGKSLPVEHCIEKTDGWELHGKIKEVFNKYVKDHVCYMMLKDTFGMDMGLDLGALKIRKIIESSSEIEMCGVATNICVLSVAVSVQSIAVNTPITIDASCCASFDDDLHEKALDVMEGLQINVINRGIENE